MRDHKSLHAWQEAHAISVAVIRMSRSSWKPYAAAEGYTFGNSPTFTRHLGIAYGSAVETGELLQLAIDADVAPGERVPDLLKRTHRAERLILGMLKQRREFRF